MKSVTKLKVGIAGYGVVGKRRRAVVDSHPRLKTIAISDIAFKRNGTLDDGVRFYKDCREMVRKEDFDLLFVCLPNYLAPLVTMQGLSRGFHVFCEKPPGRSLADIAAVREVEHDHPGLKLKYGFNHRYHDSVRDALRIIQSGELGKVLNLRGVYGKSSIISYSSGWRAQRKYAGGGILLDQGIHMVDLMRLFAGEFSEIHSVISNDFWNHDVEDNAYALMRAKNGVVAMLHSSATLWRHRFHMEITLERGAITLSGILSGTKSYGAETITVAYANERDEGDPKEVTTRYNQDNSWRDEVYEFADSILSKKSTVNGSSLDALKTMELISRIYCADPKWRKTFHLSDGIPSTAPLEKSR